MPLKCLAQGHFPPPPPKKKKKKKKQNKTKKKKKTKQKTNKQTKKNQVRIVRPKPMISRLAVPHFTTEPRRTLEDMNETGGKFKPLPHSPDLTLYQTTKY